MRSLRTKILTIVLAFPALICAAFLAYSIYTTSQYKAMRLEGIKKNIEFETEKVNKTIAEMELAAKHYALGGWLTQEASAPLGKKLALDITASFPKTIGVGFWYAPYAHTKSRYRSGFYAFNDGGEARLDDAVSDEYDYHGQSWYKEITASIKEPHQVAWSRPYVDDSGSNSLMATAGSGVFDKDGKLAAISTIDWEISQVVAELSAVRPTANSFVILCEPEKGYGITNTLTKGWGWELSSLPWDINADSISHEGARHMVFRRMMDNGWLLSVQVPQREIFADIEKHNNRFLIIIAAFSLVILCLAFLLISGLINKPIKRLTDKVSMVSLDNLDMKIEISTSDELGLLADRFNIIIANLKESIEANLREHAEKERIGAELGVAAKIQTSLLPCIFPSFPNRTEFGIFATMQPAKEVGGDFYDFFMLDENTLAVAIADVSGKGVPAALFMAIAMTLIKNNAQDGKGPAEVFEMVNNLLCEKKNANMFVTAFLGYLDIPSGKFAFVNAGHNPPLLRAGGGFDWLKAKSGFVLGGMKGMAYRQHEIVLRPGDELFLYTDGITEAANPEYNLFGNQRLLDAANSYFSLPIEGFVASIKGEVDKFADGAEQADDITMLSLRYYGEPQNAPAMKELCIEAKLENLDTVLNFVAEHIQECPSKTKNQICIAVDEIFSNIARYAYAPTTGGAVVRVAAGNEITIEFEDGGAAYDPLSKDGPDLSLSAEDRQPGGLGVFMVKKLMDYVEYQRIGNKNVLTIKKNI